jgi:hypothetical protein
MTALGGLAMSRAYRPTTDRLLDGAVSFETHQTMDPGVGLTMFYCRSGVILHDCVQVTTGAGDHFMCLVDKNGHIVPESDWLVKQDYSAPRSSAAPTWMDASPPNSTGS